MNQIAPTTEVRPAKSQFEAMAVRAIAKLKLLKEDLKEKRDELNETMLQDKEYGDLDQQVKTLNEKKKRAKDRLLQDEEIAAQAAEVKDASGEVKELKESVSEYLMEYKRETGRREITDENGVQLTIFEVNTTK